MAITVKQIQAEMTYSSPIQETIQVAGYEVEFWQDTDSECPYDWDCNSPAIWLGVGRSNELREYGNCELERIIWDMTPAFISRNWRKIAAILNCDESQHDKDAREDKRAYRYDSLSHVRQELFAECLKDMRADNWRDGIEYLDTLAALHNLAGNYAETFGISGYCQGDSAYGLIVMTPAWREKTGCNPADMAAAKRDMQSQADTFEAWLYGNVWGFSVSRGYDCNAEMMDSCGGFYGNDSEYLISQIAGSINADIQSRKDEKTTRLKAMIQARVPYAIRAAYVAQISAL